MWLSSRRIFALLVALTTLLVLNGALATAVALASAGATAEAACCDHGPSDTEEPASSCAVGDGVCCCCPVELLPGEVGISAALSACSLFRIASTTPIPAGFGAGIDYPPETC